MIEQGEHIIASAGNLFLKYGIRSVSMDDIAREAGVSKKTLYQVLGSKEELVIQVLNRHLEEEQVRINEIISTHDNAIDQMLAIFQSVLDHMRTVHPTALFDLKKYYPKASKLLDNHKDIVVFDVVVKNMQGGIKQGLYREEIHCEIVAGIYINAITYIVDLVQSQSSAYTFEVLYREYISYHLHGLVTDKGAAYLKKYKRTAK